MKKAGRATEEVSAIAKEQPYQPMSFEAPTPRTAVGPRIIHVLPEPPATARTGNAIADEIQPAYHQAQLLGHDLSEVYQQPKILPTILRSTRWRCSGAPKHS